MGFLVHHFITIMRAIITLNIKLVQPQYFSPNLVYKRDSNLFGDDSLLFLESIVNLHIFQPPLGFFSSEVLKGAETNWTSSHERPKVRVKICNTFAKPPGYFENLSKHAVHCWRPATEKGNWTQEATCPTGTSQGRMTWIEREEILLQVCPVGLTAVWRTWDGH